MFFGDLSLFFQQKIGLFYYKIEKLFSILFMFQFLVGFPLFYLLKMCYFSFWINLILLLKHCRKSYKKIKINKIKINKIKNNEKEFRNLAFYIPLF
jgi:hypothetical protein